MILPKKHITNAESLLGLGGALLLLMGETIQTEQLWREYREINNKEFPAYHGFDNFVLALDLLFTMGLIENAAEGELRRASR